MAVFAVAKKMYELESQTAGTAVFLVSRQLEELSVEPAGTASFQIARLPVEEPQS